MLLEKTCITCGKTYFVLPYRDKKTKYCSFACGAKKRIAGWLKGTKGIAKPNSGSFKKGMVSWNKGNKGIHLSPKTEFKKGLIPWNKKTPIEKSCPKCGKIFYVKPSLNRVTYCSQRCVRLGTHTSEKQKNAVRLAALGNKYCLGREPWNKGKPFLAIQGEKNHMWNGGSSKFYQSHYNNAEYRNWRRSVFIRDKFTCQHCGVRHTNINAHHIKSYTYYPEFRYDIKNGLTLCGQCHSKVDHFRIKGQKCQV
jgi:hypothetical protein